MASAFRLTPFRAPFEHFFRKRLSNTFFDSLRPSRGIHSLFRIPIRILFRIHSRFSFRIRSRILIRANHSESADLFDFSTFSIFELAFLHAPNHRYHFCIQSPHLYIFVYLYKILYFLYNLYEMYAWSAMSKV